MTLTPDLAHCPIFGKYAVLKLVPNGFGPNGAFEEIDQILVAAALAQGITKVDLVVG